MIVTIDLPFPPSVNNIFINGRKGRFPSPRYKTWKQFAGVALMQQRPARVPGRVHLTYEFAEGFDRRKRDLGNLEKATTDLLVDHRIIDGDDGSVVRAIRLNWNAEVEGVRVTIEGENECER